MNQSRVGIREHKKEQFMSDIDPSSAEGENQYHHYRGNVIPWYVRLMWLGFWILAIVYVVRFLFPAIQVELFEQP